MNLHRSQVKGRILEGRLRQQSQSPPRPLSDTANTSVNGDAVSVTGDDDRRNKKAALAAAASQRSAIGNESTFIHTLNRASDDINA
jgi:uncharacterized lipoprotein YajG